MTVYLSQAMHERIVREQLDEREIQRNSEYLFASIKKGDRQRVKSLIDSGKVDLWAAREEQSGKRRTIRAFSPMHYAINHGKEHIFKMFLEQGLDVYYKAPMPQKSGQFRSHLRNAMEAAVRHPKTGRLRDILRHNPKVAGDPRAVEALATAIETNHHTHLVLLLDAGTPLEGVKEKELFGTGWANEAGYKKALDILTSYGVNLHNIANPSPGFAPRSYIKPYHKAARKKTADLKPIWSSWQENKNLSDLTPELCIMAANLGELPKLKEILLQAKPEAYEHVCQVIDALPISMQQSLQAERNALMSQLEPSVTVTNATLSPQSSQAQILSGYKR